jgi:hypothetical protein
MDGGGVGALPPLDPATAVIIGAGDFDNFVAVVGGWGETEAGQTNANAAAPGMAYPYELTFETGTIISPAVHGTQYPGQLQVSVVRPLGHGCYKSVFEVHVIGANGQPDPAQGRFAMGICRAIDPAGLNIREVCLLKRISEPRYAGVKEYKILKCLLLWVCSSKSHGTCKPLSMPR